jgi:inorganic phosphate transporter, PiT family
MSATSKSPKAQPNTDFFSRCDIRIPLALAVGFLLLVAYVIHLMSGELEYSLTLVVAAVFGGYMALNIGANDVANNLAPAVGAKAITLTGALVIAAIFESAGALIAGGDVVSTVSKGIIDPSLLEGQHSFILLMMSALLAGALWLNLATYLGAPVSTTHSIVGAVMGAGVAAAGVSVVDWPTMGKIAASWVISPALGGIIAAVLYGMILKLVLEQANKLEASRRWVPIFIGLMVSAFTMYLIMKGLKNLISVEPVMVAVIGLVVLVVSPLAIRPIVDKRSRSMQNNKSDVKKLFTYPLIFSAALLSFAHGANDVANAVGPLAAIVSALSDGASLSAKVGIPLWVMLVGAAGLSVGLILFGGKMVNTVGQSITKLDHVRAYCVSLSAAVTVIIASALGLPVSSTHIAVGAIFGIGLFREWRDLHVRRKRRKKKKKEYEHVAIKRKLVRRRSLLSIMAAWVITVPSSFFLSAVIYLGLYYAFPA